MASADFFISVDLDGTEEGNALVGYGKRPPVPGSDRIAESWELSFVPGSEASDGAGRLYSERFSAADFGTACAGMPGFPVLTKFIDAREKLSVQVHPSDEYALAREKQYGKTEMSISIPSLL